MHEINQLISKILLCVYINTCQGAWEWKTKIEHKSHFSSWHLIKRNTRIVMYNIDVALLVIVFMFSTLPSCQASKQHYLYFTCCFQMLKLINLSANILVLWTVLLNFFLCDVLHCSSTTLMQRFSGLHWCVVPVWLLRKRLSPTLSIGMWNQPPSSSVLL